MVRLNAVWLGRQDRITAKEQKLRLYKALKRSWRKEERDVKKAEKQMQEKQKSEMWDSERAEQFEAGGKSEKKAIRSSMTQSIFGEDGEDIGVLFNTENENFRFSYKPHRPQSPCWWKSAYGMLPKAEEFADLDNIDGVLQMVEQGRLDTSPSFLLHHFLQKCIRTRSLEQGKQVHAHIVRTGLSKDRNFCNLLVEMYGACGQIEEAVKVFNNMPEKNTVTYNVMISAYANQGAYRKALDIYNRMEGVEPDDYVLATALTAAANLKSLDEGRAIHKHIMDSGLKPDLVLENAIVNMYAKCGDMTMASQLFKSMSARNATTWGILISGYIHNGDTEEALKVYKRIQHGVHKLELNTSTLVIIIGACSDQGLLLEGREIHESLSERELKPPQVTSALMNLYARCGTVGEARELFDKTMNKDIVAWNTMISAYARTGHTQEACDLYQRLLSEQGLSPDKFTFASMLSVFAELGDLQQGFRIRELVMKSPDFVSDTVLQNAFVNLYGKCGAVEEAKKLFDWMRDKDTVSWTVMINAYALNGHPDKALELFREMDIPANAATYATVIYACSVRGDFAEGKAIDEMVSRTEFKDDIQVQNALVSMYARCGQLMYAKWEFDRIRARNTISWNTLLGAYTQHGHHQLVLGIFPDMLIEGVLPDSITFIAILTCCSQKGLTSQGWEHFMSMLSDFWIEPLLEHYGCMVDLLGRSGKLGEAEELVKTMPFVAGQEQWTALLASCKMHGDTKRGARSAVRIMDLDHTEKPAYVLLSDIHAANT